jgi:polysaccharide pyruvyl transferase WcaK-like protein
MSDSVQVLVDPGTFDCRNTGDLAMLQIAVRRLRLIFPGVSIQVFTDDPVALKRHCPDVQPIENAIRHTWFGDHSLLGRLHRYLPRRQSEAAARLTRRIRNRCPAAIETLLRMKLAVRARDRGSMKAFLESVHGADLVVACGQGGMTDVFGGHARRVLDTLEMAIRHRKPTAMLGQGIGPMSGAALLARARAVLPRVNLIGLREGRAGAPLLASVGVLPSRVVVTGDDAVELAYEARRPELGRGLGVNLRVAPHAETDDSLIGRIRPVLQRFAERHGVSLLPLPIAMHPSGTDDSRVLRELLRDDGSDGGRSLDTPLRVIQRTGECRVVVTGAYHAAVFALAQGVPTICLGNSAYVLDKFWGLTDLFGAGCRALALRSADLPEELSVALEDTWSAAPQLRAPLLEAARLQVAAGQAAYERVSAFVTPRRAAA